MVVAYGRHVQTKDRRKAYPIPFCLIEAWERTLCVAKTSQRVKLFLGAVLACTRASIRFGDAQWVRWETILLSAMGLHATCRETKTTRAGQPFACAWHDISGRDASSSWRLAWLAALSTACKDPQLNGHGSPDLHFTQCTLAQANLAQLAPACYACTLLRLRWAAQSSACSGSAALQLHEAAELTLHSRIA